MARQCTHRTRAGIVSNQDLAVFDRSRPLASRAVCAREECIAAAIKWSAGETNEPARFYPDPQETK